MIGEGNGHPRQAFQGLIHLVWNVVLDVPACRELHRDDDQSRYPATGEVFQPAVNRRLGNLQKAWLDRGLAGQPRRRAAEVQKCPVPLRPARAMPDEQNAGLAVQCVQGKGRSKNGQTLDVTGRWAVVASRRHERPGLEKTGLPDCRILRPECEAEKRGPAGAPVPSDRQYPVR